MTISEICKELEVFKENILGRIMAVDKMATDNAKDIEEVKKSFVTRVEFDPIKTIVYSLVGMILTAAIAALLRLILKQ